MIDFSVPPEIAEVRKAVGDFMDRHVYPAEREMSDEGEGLPLELLRTLQGKAKASGLWAPHMPVEVGGLGIGVVALALLNEVIGRSPIGPIVLGCQAPDAGNCEILHLYGTEAQKRRWLIPNVAGE
ncbi:MAG TPA: acyl-CoA dehydrogenase family protein, partial [Solirubrobacterales bacterium]|nr:acyl-CoA dehydrogenase family protein [Solirubrobacterales bacterium]